MENIKDQLAYATPFHTQVSVLLERTWRSIWREKVYSNGFYLNITPLERQKRVFFY
jgi:hypothetical protein